MSKVSGILQFKRVFAFFILLMSFTMVMPTAMGSSDISQKFVAVDNGEMFVLALRDDGTVWTWGRMYCGEPVKAYVAGRDTDVYYWEQVTPVQAPISDVIAISAGGAHCMALKKDGTVWTWGVNFDGQLGDGTTNGTSRGNITPVQVIGLENVTAISARGSSSFALKKDGTVWAWGYNRYGRLGDGTQEKRLAPVQVIGLTNVTSIWGGSFAVKDDGSVWTWGITLIEPDKKGRMDSEWLEAHSKPTPFQIPSLNNITAIDNNEQHTIFVKSDGTVWCWGYDFLGQLGYGTAEVGEPSYITAPVQAKNIIDIKAVSASNDGSMALKVDGTVWAWGNNGEGQLGSDILSIVPVPVQVPGLNGVAAMSSKYSNSVFLKDDGSVWVCGDGGYGQKGDGTVIETIDEPIRVLGPIEESYPSAMPSQMVTPTSPGNNSTPFINASTNSLQNDGLLSIMILGTCAIILIVSCIIYWLGLRKI